MKAIEKNAKLTTKNIFPVAFCILICKFGQTAVRSYKINLFKTALFFMKQYSMTEADRTGQMAVQDCTKYLLTLPQTRKVLDVQEDEDFQKLDIDLLVWFNKNGAIEKKRIEVKGDRYHHTGNYFFETVSNKAKQTPGCFLYTGCDYLFYYFIAEQELHILTMPEIRNWFLKDQNRFKISETSTPVGDGSRYITVGRLVPRRLLREEMTPYVKTVNLSSYLTE